MSTTSRSCKFKLNPQSKKTNKPEKKSKSLKKLKSHKESRTKITSVQKKIELANSKSKIKEKKQLKNEKIQEIEYNGMKTDLKELKLLEKNLTKCISSQKNPVKVKQPIHEPPFISIDFKLKDHEILEDLIAIKRSIISAKSKGNADQ